MNEGDVLPSVERIITQDRIGKYATASGDFNPIHIDEAFAAESQFGGTIAHGMLVAAAISEVMTSAFGLDWLESGRFKLRFRAPVFPGDMITAYGRVKAVRERTASIAPPIVATHGSTSVRPTTGRCITAKYASIPTTQNGSTWVVRSSIDRATEGRTSRMTPQAASTRITTPCGSTPPTRIT